MFNFLGYNFLLDKNALDYVPTNINNLNSVQIQNGVYDELYITKDVSQDYNTNIPEWNYDTIFDAKFEGNLSAGNLQFLSNTISEIRIKRRKKGDFNWITIGKIVINDFSDINNIVFNDYFNENNIEYEYAFVPVVEGAEGEYIINSVFSQFDGIYIADIDSIYKMYSGVSYGATTRVQQVGVFEPFGRKYPIIVSNSKLNYEQGSMSGNVLPSNYLEERVFDKIEIKKEKNAILDFLTNGKPKILKDWNGNIWCVFITDSPSVEYDKNSSLSLVSINFNWTEIGDLNIQEDWDNNDLVKEG